MAKSKSHPQFFHTLAPGFKTHLTIPEDFFIKYIQGNCMEKSIAEVKSNSSEITWNVKMSGRSLSEGWEEFAFANNLEIGDVVVVRYEGVLVFNVLDLGPNWSENSDLDIHRMKRVKKNNAEAESFVVLVTASNLRTDTMCLPQHFTSSNGFSRKCCEIVLKDERERSWELDLAFNILSDTFYISRGWSKFCRDNGQTAGGFFMFKLVKNEETPVLSFCPTESTSDRRESDCSEASGRESLSTGLNSEEENVEGESSEDERGSVDSLKKIEKKKCHPIRSSYSFYLPCHKQFIRFTLPPDYVKIRMLTLPKPFLRDNGINKPGKMYLLGKDGKKWPTQLHLDSKGTIKMGKGWKDFVVANGLTDFTLKLTWEDTTPVLSVCPPECNIDRGPGQGRSDTNQKKSLPVQPCSTKKISKDDNSREEINSWERGKNNLRGSDPIPSNQKRIVTLKLTPSSFSRCRLVLPAQFVRENSINKHGKIIYLSGKDGIKWLTILRRDKNGRMSLGKGWKEFVEANELKSCDSFKVELIWEDATPILRLVCSEAIENVSISPEPRSRDSSSAIKDRSVTLSLTLEDVKACKLHLPSEFMKVNGINKLGEITILGENVTEWSGYLLSREGTVALGHGWKEFCEASGVKLGESFTLEFVNRQNLTPVLKFCS